jgi:NAD(P)-dependent dehydrogenase (short-subunit alcohol dehydrogenase family)
VERINAQLAAEGRPPFQFKTIHNDPTPETSARSYLEAFSHAKGFALKADSADPTAVQRAVAQAVEMFRRLDIVEVNAGILLLGSVDRQGDGAAPGRDLDRTRPPVAVKSGGYPTGGNRSRRCGPRHSQFRQAPGGMRGDRCRSFIRQRTRPGSTQLTTRV